MSRWWPVLRQPYFIWRGEWVGSCGAGDALSEVDIVYLKNVLLKFISAQSTGKTTVSLLPGACCAADPQQPEILSVSINCCLSCPSMS